MAIDATKVYQLAHSAKTHSLSGSICMLGVQTIYPSGNEIAQILEQLGLCLAGNGDLYESLGFDCMESLDISDYEGCTHIFDLNSDNIPDPLIERFDVVYNGGTLEHVFNLPAALCNIFKMLKPGGVVIHAGPSNGMVDHGFYQFSPTLFADYYLSNNFEVLELQLLEYRRGGREVVIHSYIPGCSYTSAAGGIGGRCAIYGVFRKGGTSTCQVIPQQRHYNFLYGDPAVVATLNEQQYLPPYMLRDGRVVKEKPIRMTLGDIRQGIGHEWMVKLPEFADISDKLSDGLSPLQLWEGETALGPPHCRIKDVRELGGGRFSHWNAWLYFSTSDNCEPGDREYSVTIPVD